MPTPAASSIWAPVAPMASATASAAGTTLEDGCSTDGRWVSSKSREWARVPLTSAAAALGTRIPEAMAVASGGPPQPRTTAVTADADVDSSPDAARLLPTRSNTRRATS